MDSDITLHGDIGRRSESSQQRARAQYQHLSDAWVSFFSKNSRWQYLITLIEQFHIIENLPQTKNRMKKLVDLTEL